MVRQQPVRSNQMRTSADTTSMTTATVHGGQRVGGEKRKTIPQTAAVLQARLRRRLPAVCLVLAGFLSLLLIVRAPPSLVTGSTASGIPLTSGYESQIEHGSSEIVVIAPPFQVRNNSGYSAASLKTLLHSLESARYDTSVQLRVLLAPERDVIAFAARHALVAASEWAHGEFVVSNATSGGLFEIAIASWSPAQGSPDHAVIVDASRARRVQPGWFEFIERARARYRGRADIAAFAPEPISIRSKSSVTGRFSNWSPPGLGEEAVDDVFLYQGAPYAPVIAPINAAVWRSFQRWFHSKRAEWFMWPSIVKPRNRLDAEWGGYTARGRAHWTMWYARFLAEHELYVLYPREKDPRPPSLALAMSSDILRVKYDGTVQKSVRDADGTGATKEELNEIVSMAKQAGGSVSLTIVNEAFLTTARSWICNVDVAGIRPPAVVWIATDRVAYEGLRGVQGTRAVHMRSFRGGTAATGTEFNTPGYWRLMLERTRLIRDLLDRGVGVFAFETDQIWLRDPIPAVRRLVESGDGVDLVGTLDTRRQIGGNFLYFAPTLATQRLWREVSRRFAVAYFSAGMHGHTARFKRYIENDQSIMTNLVFYDAAFRAVNPIVFRALDTDRFVDGRWYKGNEFYGASARSPTMINNNFLIGIEAKEIRARKHGHWFWNRERGECDVDAVRNAVRRNEAHAAAAARAAAAFAGSNAAPESDFDVGLDKAIEGIAKSLKVEH